MPGRDGNGPKGQGAMRRNNRGFGNARSVAKYGPTLSHGKGKGNRRVFGKNLPPKEAPPEKE